MSADDRANVGNADRVPLTIDLGTLVMIRESLEVDRGVTVSIDEARYIMTIALRRLRAAEVVE